jgi:hypothetical protein
MYMKPNDDLLPCLPFQHTGIHQKMEPCESYKYSRHQAEISSKYPTLNQRTTAFNYEHHLDYYLTACKQQWTQNSDLPCALVTSQVVQAVCKLNAYRKLGNVLWNWRVINKVTRIIKQIDENHNVSVVYQVK